MGFQHSVHSLDFSTYKLILDFISDLSLCGDNSSFTTGLFFTFHVFVHHFAKLSSSFAPFSMLVCKILNLNLHFNLVILESMHPALLLLLLLLLYLFSSVMLEPSFPNVSSDM